VSGSTVVIGWGLAAALLILVGLAVAANAAGSLGRHEVERGRRRSRRISTASGTSETTTMSAITGSR